MKNSNVFVFVVLDEKYQRFRLPFGGRKNTVRPFSGLACDGVPGALSNITLSLSALTYTLVYDNLIHLIALNYSYNNITLVLTNTFV